MNNLQLFNSPQFGEVRAMLVGQEPYFVGNDVATALGYQIPKDAIQQHVDDDEKRLVQLSDIQGGGETPPPHMKGAKIVVINESGVYSLVFGSKLPQAKAFKKWVTSEVLPSIRKHGGYLTQDKLAEALTNPDTLILLATQLKEERAEKQRLEEQNEVHKQQLQLSAPKVQYYNDVLMSASTYNTNQIAKELGMSAVTLNRKLRELGVQYAMAGQWLLYAKYQNKGYTKTHTHPFTHTNGTTGTAMQTVWTEQGRQFIHQILGRG